MSSEKNEKNAFSIPSPAGWPEIENKAHWTIQLLGKPVKHTDLVTGETVDVTPVVRREEFNADSATAKGFFVNIFEAWFGCDNEAEYTVKTLLGTTELELPESVVVEFSSE